MKRPFSPVAALLLGLSLGEAFAAAPGGGPPGSGGPMAPATQAVSVVLPQRVDLTRRLTANGSIFAWQEIVIAPEVGGYQVAAVNVEIGDRVKRGQELARLTADLLESQVEVERAAVAQARALLVNAQASLQRGESVATSGALSKADLDTLRANAATAQAAVSSADANYSAAALRLKLTHVLAPDDGVISARSVNIGQVVQAGSEIMRLLRKGRVEWRAEVPEGDLQKVKPGQKVTLTSVTGQPLSGTVRSVAPTVQTTNRTGLVYVDVASSSDARPGMFARGDISVGTAQALMVPLAAVLVQDGYSYVFVLRADSTVERRRVTTGSIVLGQIEISSGLDPTEKIVASGVAFLSDTQKVNVQPAP
ncbi:MAG TPA: efflux RND transporter periplasmic adaptor subunit [Steroidobacteraceae bacterium]|nr:efflux RND transporter periplasmic adaptor subunit [Steroidobacteraceae bacterium]